MTLACYFLFDLFCWKVLLRMWCGILSYPIGFMGGVNFVSVHVSSIIICSENR